MIGHMGCGESGRRIYPLASVEFICTSGKLGAWMALWCVWVRSHWKGSKFSDLRHELMCNRWRLGTGPLGKLLAHLYLNKELVYTL